MWTLIILRKELGRISELNQDKWSGYYELKQAKSVVSKKKYSKLLDQRTEANHIGYRTSVKRLEVMLSI
jgi:hypothetical protein